ncbi:MAG: hypothetical protein IJX39_02735 [Clostridia bacterium]|nr:hypothetical protein [Clostridia bacterium]
MIKKRVLPIVGCAIMALVLILWVVYCLPKTFLSRVDAADVQCIRVFDSSDGSSFVIDEREDINAIVTRLQKTKMKRGKLSSNYDGFRFSLTFVGQDGEVLETLILNSADTIRKDPFFYETKDAGRGLDTDDEKLPFSELESMKGKYVK